MREIPSWNPTHRSQAAIDAAVETTMAAQKMLAELLEMYTPEQLEAMGFDPHSHTDNPNLNKHFVDLTGASTEEVLRGTQIWNPLDGAKKQTTPESVEPPSIDELLNNLQSKTAPQPVFGTIEDKVVSGNTYSQVTLEVASLSVDGLSHQVQPPAQTPPFVEPIAGATS